MNLVCGNDTLTLFLPSMIEVRTIDIVADSGQKVLDKSYKLGAIQLQEKPLLGRQLQIK